REVAASPEVSLLKDHSQLDHPDGMPDSAGHERCIDLFLIKLAEMNIKLSVHEGSLRINAPSGILTEQLKSELKENKVSLIRKLKNRKVDIQVKWPELISDLNNRYDPFPLSDVQGAYWVGRSGIFEFGDVSTHYYYELSCDDL